MNTALPPFILKSIARLEDLIELVDGTPPTQRVVSAGIRRDGTRKTFGYDVKFSPELSCRIEQAIIDIAPKSVCVSKVAKVEYAHDKVQVAKALCADLKAGYYNDANDFAHAEVFSDFLEMAQYLFDKGFLVPATVIGGSSAESHLRQLAKKYGVDTEKPNGVPLNGGALNDGLAKVQAYSVIEQKQIMVWQALRNDAAHGNKSNDQLDRIQVQNMITGIQNFMVNHPA